MGWGDSGLRRGWLVWMVLSVVACAEPAAPVAGNAAAAAVVSDPFVDAVSPDPAVALPAIADLGERSSPATVDALLVIARNHRQPQLGAAREALVVAAERSLQRGNGGRAADWALHVYHSSAPHPLRRRALVVSVRGSGEASLDRLEDIVEGRLDARFLDVLPELLAEIPGERARALERRLQ